MSASFRNICFPSFHGAILTVYSLLPAVPMKTCPAAPCPIHSVSDISRSISSALDANRSSIASLFGWVCDGMKEEESTLGTIVSTKGPLGFVDEETDLEVLASR